jgi:hypothetical protein
MVLDAAGQRHCSYSMYFLTVKVYEDAIAKSYKNKRSGRL